MHEVRETQIDPLLYLASTTIACWWCGGDMPSGGLIAPNVSDTEGEACILADIMDLPVAGTLDAGTLNGTLAH